MSLTDANIQRWPLIAWLLLTAWLLACALLLQGEYGDGYQTIANARYFFGDSTEYYVQRGPLAAIALWPAQMFVSLFDVDPIDVRPYHVLSAILHSAYLIACWQLIKYTMVSGMARLLAFTAAILSSVFYAYAPYLSHDLLPGLLFLIQIFLCDRWIRKPSARDAILLIILGAAVTLIKQTYAIFWVAILVYAVLAFVFKWDKDRLTLRKLISLGALGGASAALSWLSYGLFVAAELPHAPLLLRPLRLIIAVSAQYPDDLSTIFERDLYLRNILMYGTAAVLLITPGLVLALRGANLRLRQIAVCWIVSAIAISLIDFREVRYLGFLAPLTAMLIALPIEKLLTRRSLTAVLVLVVLFDQIRGLTIAAEQLSSTARINVKQFISAAEGTTVHASKVLSFVYDGDSGFLRDRYHGIYHLSPELLQRLHEGKLQVATIKDPRALGTSDIKTGDRVYYSNNTLVRRPPWDEDNLPNDLGEYLLIAGQAEDIRLVRRNGGFERTSLEREHLLFIPGSSTGPQMPVISTGKIAYSDATRLFGNIEDRDFLDVKAVVVKALCQADYCIYR